MEDVRYLREEMRAWFEAMKQQRLEDRALSTQRHSENIARFAKQDEKLDSIDDQVHATNGRVTKAEEQIRTLFNGVAGPRGERGEKGDERTVTRFDLRYLILAFAAGGAFIVWLLHLVGKLA